ncbi:GntR family transcriptional regulator [Arthrobacter sp. I2-34]|uniref:GntR family transcriptional regulator n=1 Tax=Arthrobacter hankyongi TaxID=2904801 RepID=A0ABS9L2P5_9MICC|nr:GntR family transcriptional regulator [Arthrobacter hankyongi]MCG2620767.1 GntR family transcriptional regulator [Arthrobacter hankyongi]
MPVPPAHDVHKRSLLRDDVYASLRDAIVDGTLAPGERLRDAELGSWLGVSRTPIREALLRLERAGLVVARPGHSTTVAEFDPASTLSAQQVSAAMHELAARLAVPLLPDGALHTLADANRRFAAALAANDVEAAMAADDAFHGVFVAACGNPLVAEVLEQTTPVLRRVERLRFASLQARGSVAQHERIIELAGRADAEGTALAVRDNWLSLRFTAAGPDTRRSTA